MFSLRTQAQLSRRLVVTTVPQRSDNYAYVVHCDQSKACAVVDPGDPSSSSLVDTVKEFHLAPEFILLTHHHHDHVDGVARFRSQFPKTRVLSLDPRSFAAAKINDGEVLKNKDNVALGDLDVTCLETPGHTIGHCAFDVRERGLPVSDDPEGDQGAVFVGDTLFVGGAGRLMEGTPAQLYASMFDVLFQLPRNTLMYCGHEYTEANLRFAMSIEPDNGRLSDMMASVAARRDAKLPTVPAPLFDEFRHNVFARCRERALAKRLGFFEWGENNQQSHIEVLRELRSRKDEF